MKVIKVVQATGYGYWICLWSTVHTEISKNIGFLSSKFIGAVTLLTCIREVPGSNLRQDTYNLKENAGIVLLIRLHQLPFTSFLVCCSLTSPTFDAI
jgi:hypothetical protein